MRSVSSEFYKETCRGTISFAHFRGEIQLQFELQYERPSLSISSSSLNKIGGDGVFDKMKRKMNKLTHHKKAEDTFSVASGFSSASMRSSHSGNKILSRLNKTFGGLHKSSTLPNQDHSFAENKTDADLDSSSPIFSPSSHFLSPSNNHISRGNSLGSGLEMCNVDGNTIAPLNIHADGPLASSTPLAISPMASATEFVHHIERTNSVRSVGSSGFGSTKYASNQKLRDSSHQELLRQLDSLKLELQVKNSRLRDMQEYMDNLITRVMDHCPEILAAPIATQKMRHSFY